MTGGVIYLTHELLVSLRLILFNSALLNVSLSPFFVLFTTVYFPQVIWFILLLSVFLLPFRRVLSILNYLLHNVVCRVSAVVKFFC